MYNYSRQERCYTTTKLSSQHMRLTCSHRGAPRFATLCLPFFLALMGASALKIISPGISDDQYQSKESKVKTQVSQNGLALYIEIEK